MIRNPAANPVAKPAATRGVDVWLIVASGILLLIGMMSLFSIDHGSEGSRHFSRQLLRLGIGLVPFAFFYFVRPSFLLRYANLLYVVNAILLILVLRAGSSGGGAQRWLNFGPIDFQPSEMSKILTVVTLAAFFAKRDADANRLSTFVLSIVHVAIPLLLIFLQPHFGASLVILVVWLAVSVAAGLKARYLVGAVGLAAIAIAGAVLIPGVLKAYQVERLHAMFGGSDQDERFQIMRAQMAFASGGVTGVGFLKGEFKLPGFVPEQHTDFIFTVIGEEGGLVGCGLVLAAYGFFFYRIWRITLRADDPFHRMIGAGIFAVLAFHTVVNLGMNLELLPVVGLWLPFMSYGGTAIWLCLGSVGLLLNLDRRARPILFG
ncbi:MAG TPA: FtsW/RodA/SpoVE family cell cycle protein [Fimbriimonadaceae bacterium]|nr:FtsW/RodA/SpoVE family cell cycle protein [Fimbriimonadaceae bacterium]